MKKTILLLLFSALFISSCSVSPFVGSGLECINLKQAKKTSSISDAQFLGIDDVSTKISDPDDICKRRIIDTDGHEIDGVIIVKISAKKIDEILNLCKKDDVSSDIGRKSALSLFFSVKDCYLRDREFKSVIRNGEFEIKDRFLYDGRPSPVFRQSMAKQLSLFSADMIPIGIVSYGDSVKAVCVTDGIDMMDKSSLALRRAVQRCWLYYFQ